jgi:hypothetical protein
MGIFVHVFSIVGIMLMHLGGDCRNSGKVWASAKPRVFYQIG